MKYKAIFFDRDGTLTYFTQETLRRSSFITSAFIIFRLSCSASVSSSTGISLSSL